MGGGVAVAANDRRAGQTQAKFGTDNVHDALAYIQDRNVGHAECLDVHLQRLNLDAAVFLFYVGRGSQANGGNVVVRHGNREVGPTQFAAGEAQSLERLRTGDLVQKVAVDVKDAGTVREPLHDMAVPDFVKQRARCGTGHGLPLLARIVGGLGLAEHRAIRKPEGRRSSCPAFRAALKR